MCSIHKALPLGFLTPKKSRLQAMQGVSSLRLASQTLREMLSNLCLAFLRPQVTACYQDMHVLFCLPKPMYLSARF